ncbi:late competence development ComFB family protein [Alicyclobacillus macrosporangiidus]|jgi:competence protein ComFB|uniref:Competence protein ComFB n=1 Tax=Alicyclobacillus macrosporangiidus TaxID=392015 RepID=A0A1I7KRZ3_9BACL|nr:late competence development ComFB family protein [Alicyclobacillus macrosporangiidus]SFV00210.1 competence protein ComFB [Alicyclobacillus macrosporangiidus]
MTVYNVTEAMVRSLLEDAYLKRGLVRCGCSQCIDDILAIALNHLPSHYVSTEHGTAYVKAKYFEPQMQSDMLRELALAVDIVARRPRHAIPEGEAPGSQPGASPV